MTKDYAPTVDMFYPSTPRGNGRGLGKPIRNAEGKIVDSRFMVYEASGRYEFVKASDYYRRRS